MGFIDRAAEGFCAWCAKDTAAARLERTIAQGVVAVAVTGLTTGEWGAAALTGVVMAVISPVQAAMGNGGEVR